MLKQYKKGIGDMKFDVVVGNPPYNNDIYIDFVTSGNRIAREYSVWITPAQWQAKGGDKNETFRKNIVPYISKIVYYPNCSDIFLIGQQAGISYYLIDKHNKHDEKDIKNVCKRQNAYNNESHRIMDNTLNNIIQQIYNNSIKTINSKTYKWKDFGHYKKYCVAINNKVNNERGVQGQYQAYGTISYATGQSNVICKPFLIEDIQEEIDLTNADKVIYTSDTKEDCISLMSWLNTKFVRFFIYGNLIGISPVISDINFRLVPDPGAFDHIFTDEELYKKYNLTDEEISIIESVIKERK